MDETCVNIVFSGEQTVRCATEAANRLRDALQHQDHVVIDCEGITFIDLSFIQLLLSARKSALLSKKRFSLKQAASGPLLECLQAAGFLAVFDGGDRLAVFDGDERAAELNFWTNRGDA